MRGREGVGDLDAVLERLVERELAPRETGGEGLPVQILHDEEIDAVLLPDVEQRADVRVRQRRDGAGLALETLAGGRVAGQVRRQDLEGDGAVQARISRPVDLPLPPAPAALTIS